MKLDDLLNYYAPDPEPLDRAAQDRILAAARIPGARRPRRALRMGLIAAAVAAALTGTVLAVVHYTKISDGLEETWNDMAETEMTSEQKDYIEQRSADIGESVTDQGISITVDSVSVTSDTVYLLYTVEMAKSGDQLGGSMQDSIQVTASDGNTYSAAIPVADRLVEDGGSGISYYRILTFELPEGVTLSNGQMDMEISALMVNDMERTEGTWEFAFTLPEGETARNYTVDQTLNFSDGAALEISSIAVSESRITFDYSCNITEAMILDGDVSAIEEVKAADPDVRYVYVFYAKCSDGSTVPVTGGGSVYSESRQVNECAFYWSVPLDLSALESIVFSDGATEIEVPLSE